MEVLMRLQRIPTRYLLLPVTQFDDPLGVCS